MTTEQREPLYASTAKPWLKYYDQKYIDMPLPKCSAFEYLCHQNKNHLPDTALEYYGRKITFADLIVNVKKTAAAFRGIGVKKGDIITVVSVMTPEVIYAFYAADMIGAGMGETVIIVTGSTARIATGSAGASVDATVVGIVDDKEFDPGLV